MTSLTPAVASFVDSRITGVLATVSKAGRPRQSTVYFAREDDRLLITTEVGRLKAADVERTGWASLSLAGAESPFPSATLAGPARIVTTGIGPATAHIMQRIMGAAEPPEPQTDEALAAVGRVILEITIERVGPVTYIEDAG